MKCEYFEKCGTSILAIFSFPPSQYSLRAFSSISYLSLSIIPTFSSLLWFNFETNVFSWFKHRLFSLHCIFSGNIYLLLSLTIINFKFGRKSGEFWPILVNGTGQKWYRNGTKYESLREEVVPLLLDTIRYHSHQSPTLSPFYTNPPLSILLSPISSIVALYFRIIF